MSVTPNADVLQAPLVDRGRVSILVHSQKLLLILLWLKKVSMFLSVFSITEIVSSWQPFKKLFLKKQKVVL